MCDVAQAALEAERLALQSRLKDALKLHMAPRMHLDTSSVIDHTVTLLDGLLEASPRACTTKHSSAWPFAARRKKSWLQSLNSPLI